jgi:hypothetical protein
MSDEWKTLRVVVEVRVPAKPRIAVSDLRYQVEMALQHWWKNGIPLPREREGCYKAKPHVKDFGRVARHHFAEARAPDKPRFGFEFLVLRALGFVLAVVISGISNARQRTNGYREMRAWNDDAATYLGMPKREVDLDRG